MDVLNADDDTTSADWESKLHPSFTSEVSAEQLAELLNKQIRPARPFTVTYYQADDLHSVTEIRNDKTSVLDMTVAINDKGQITGLFFAEASLKEVEGASSLEELQQRLEDFPADIRALIISGDDLASGETATLDMENLKPGPIGSTFKLYVLLALDRILSTEENDHLIEFLLFRAFAHRPVALRLLGVSCWWDGEKPSPINPRTKQ